MVLDQTTTNSHPQHTKTTNRAPRPVLCYKVLMPKPRGREHTSLTETAQLVVKELQKIPDIKMIAPGEIRTTKRNTAGKRFVTFVRTMAGLELIITGQSVQKVSVHTDDSDGAIQALQSAKTLREFAFAERERQPGI